MFTWAVSVKELKGTYSCPQRSIFSNFNFLLAESTYCNSMMLHADWGRSHAKRSKTNRTLSDLSQHPAPANVKTSNSTWLIHKSTVQMAQSNSLWWFPGGTSFMAESNKPIFSNAPCRFQSTSIFDRWNLFISVMLWEKQVPWRKEQLPKGEDPLCVMSPDSSHSFTVRYAPAIPLYRWLSFLLLRVMTVHTSSIFILFA